LEQTSGSGTGERESDHALHEEVLPTIGPLLRLIRASHNKATSFSIRFVVAVAHLSRPSCQVEVTSASNFGKTTAKLRNSVLGEVNPTHETWTKVLL
jgi:hypothetical protein